MVNRDSEINAYLQEHLRSEGLSEISAVEAARALDRAGLLRDSKGRPGLPLRELLRDGRIAGADQRPPRENGRWFVTRASLGRSAPTPGGGRESSRAFGVVPGDVVIRSELHRDYGGSGRGGIAPSRTSPNVFLFTDPAVGHQHGYYDGWLGDYFLYTGMGQRGDMTLTAGNKAVLLHREGGRAVRLFRGAGGTITYLGKFETDLENPFYLTDAQETGGGPVRQVIVFRLKPIGDVLHDPQDAFQPPPGVASADIEAAVDDEAAVIRSVPVEALNVETMIVAPRREEVEADRREQQLVHAYRDYLEASGSSIRSRHILPPGEVKPIRVDLLDESREALIEAKGTVTREALRMAVGQLADYGRFIPHKRKAVLVPSRPRRDLEALLESADIAVVWKTAEGYADNADGFFT
jgi:hypothetical protein